jgi:hypothetical protein
MNNLPAPPVPELSDEWITAHRERLVREIATPQRRQVSRRLALTGVGALAAVGASSTAALLAFAGAGAPSAFAGWTATPTRPASGETAGALGSCTSQLAGAPQEQPGIPASGWQPLLTDTRGPFTAMILKSGSTTATCVTGPSFTSTAASAAPTGGASEHVISSGHSASVGSASANALASVSALRPGGAGPITEASDERLTTDSGQGYTFVQGQVANDVTGITLALSDGSSVQATVAGGSFVAWWPGSTDPTSASVASSSGVMTQQLTFAPLPVPPVPPPSASRGSSPGGPSLERHESSTGPSPESREASTGSASTGEAVTRLSSRGEASTSSSSSSPPSLHRR